MRYRSLLTSFFLGLSLCVANSAYAATSSSTHVILRMGDGRFYDPASGRSAASEAELFSEAELVTRAPIIVPTPPLIPGAPVMIPLGTASTTIVTPLNASVTGTIPTILPESPLSLAVQRGKQLLLGKELSSSTKATTDQGWRFVNLAVWTPDTDTMEMVRVQKKGSALRLLDAVHYQIQVRTANGIDSTYIVTSLLNASSTPKVVAVRYPLYHPVKVGKKTTYHIEEVIYTPYARSLHTPEIIARGKAFLDRRIDEVYATLQTKKVASIAYPNKLVTDVVRPEVAKAILLIEHTDQVSLRENPQNTLETFYAELGLNEDLTYAYEESPVGASGAPQFMPATYKALTKQTELELDPDFTRGMRNLKNAMTAQVVYLDRLLSVMPDDVQATYLKKPYEAGAYVVASYNAGEVRVRRAVQVYGENWDELHSGQTAKLETKQAVLVKEIASYKKKLKTKAVKASASKTKTLKKELSAAQSKNTILATQIDTLKKSSLRPETFHYLEKYRLVLPYLTASIEMGSTSSTTATVRAASL